MSKNTSNNKNNEAISAAIDLLVSASFELGIIDLGAARGI